MAPDNRHTQRSSGGKQGRADIFRLVAEKAPVLVFLYRKKFIYANPRALKILGYSFEELEKTYVWEVVHPEYADLVRETIERRLKGEQIHREYTELPVKTKGGGFRIFRLYATTVRWKDGYAGLAVGIDITREKELEEKLYREKVKLETILANAHDLVSIVDRKGVIRYISPSVEKLLGWSAEELTGKLFIKFIHPEDVRKLSLLRTTIFQEPETLFTEEFRILTREGGYRWIEANIFLPASWKELELEGPIVNMRDITEKKLAQESIFKATYYDPLTGLPNRILFIEKLKDILKIAELRGDLVGVVVIDLMRFKDVNAVHGIRAGDLLLKEIAQRLVTTLRNSDVVGRFFADEFGIILTGVKSFAGLSRALDKIRLAFEEPFEIGGRRIYVGINTGVAVFPRDDTSADHLLRKAELALSRAKEMGAGAYAFFSADAEKEITEIAILRSLLKDAIRRGEIKVHYQPIFELAEMRIVGLEALARWEHPELGFIPPSKFIPIAEETGLIVDMGYCITDTAIRDLSLLHLEGFTELYVSVNFSARQFEEMDLIRRINQNLRVYNMKPESFLIEITESTAMKNPERTKDLFEEIRRTGIKTAIDDFGTGYSSMNYLIEFDVDKIKIDRSFIRRMVENEKAESVVRAVIHMSASMRAVSLAEGVENEIILVKLKEMGCGEAQGFHLAPPMDMESLRDYLRNLPNRD